MISIQFRGPDGFGVMAGDNWWVMGEHAPFPP